MFVTAGDRKVEGNPHAPLPAEARAEMQAAVDRIYGLFTDTVGAHGRISAQAAQATEAGTFFGELAIDAGLADELGTAEDALAHLTGRIKPRRKAPSTFGGLAPFPASERLTHA